MLSEERVLLFLISYFLHFVANVRVETPSDESVETKRALPVGSNFLLAICSFAAIYY